VITKHRSVSLNTTVAKASSGAIEHVPVAMVNNLNECIRKLKEQRIWVFGLDGSGEIELGQADLKLPLAIVVGGEGQGLSQMVRKNCDFVVKIPMRGKINSLNASVAAAVMMYEVVRQRRA
jgi:23S rRNA (guanosine2251-2'-O)-methyltransferase